MKQAPTQPPALATIGGWPINISAQRQALCLIVEAAERGESFAVFTLNLDHLDKLKRTFVTRTLRPGLLRKMEHRLPFWRPARAHVSSGPRVLVIPLARAAAERRLPIYLFGTDPHILAGAGDVLRRHAGQGFDIVGSSSPSRNFDPMGPEADAALDAIAASGARLCFVALGAPKQEIFAARGVARGGRTGFVCIGAGLDFLVGAQVRAPVIMRSIGLEWMWRLASDPRRLAQRYLRCAIILAEIAIAAPAKRRLQKMLS